MTRDETKFMLATLTSVYPPSLLPPVTETTVNVWFQVMEDLIFKDVTLAVAAWISTNKYPPTISDIREKVTKASMPEIESADAAWGKVMRAVRAFGWSQKGRARKELGERIWKVVENFDWMYYCNMPMDSESTYYAQFRGAYESRVKRDAEQAQVPKALTIALGSMRDKAQGIESGGK